MWSPYVGLTSGPMGGPTLLQHLTIATLIYQHLLYFLKQSCKTIKTTPTLILCKLKK